jgi:hypothetical protein
MTWNDRIADKEIPLRAGEKRNFMNTLIKIKINFIWYILRSNSTLKTRVEGLISGKGCRARRRTEDSGQIMILDKIRLGENRVD